MRKSLAVLLGGILLFLWACSAPNHSPTTPSQPQRKDVQEGAQDPPHETGLAIFTDDVIRHPVEMQNRPDLKGDILLSNGWRITEDLHLAAGALSTGSGILIRLDADGSSSLIGLGVYGAPGPAHIIAVKDRLVIVSQGLGYFGYDYVTNEVTRVRANGDPR